MNARTVLRRVRSHVKDSVNIRVRLGAYGYKTLGEGILAALPKYIEVMDMPEDKRPQSFAIVINQVPNTEEDRVCAGRSTGYFLAWIVRDGDFITCVNADNPHTLNVDKLYGYA